MNDKFVKYDVIIIGAGPIGLACGIEAKKAGLRYRIIEKGCLVNSIYHYPANMTFFSTSERLELGGIPFISTGSKPTRTEALEYYRRVADSYQLSINLYEKVVEVNDEDAGYTVITEKGHYLAGAVIVAIGFYDNPNLLGVPGEELPKVKHYYDEPHPYFGQNVIVVGGGNSAVDAALETYRRGANVTMVVKKDALDKGVKYWVRPDIENRIQEGSIKAYFNAVIVSIHPTSVTVKLRDEKITIENDFVLAMTGYHPDFSFLRRLGIELQDDEDNTPVHNPETFETNKKNIYLAGVVCSGANTGKWFIENSRYHAERVISRIAEDK